MIANVTTLRTKRTGIAEAIRTSRNLNMAVFASLVARGAAAPLGCGFSTVQFRLSPPADARRKRNRLRSVHRAAFTRLARQLFREQLVVALLIGSDEDPFADDGVFGPVEH